MAIGKMPRGAAGGAVHRGQLVRSAADLDDDAGAPDPVLKGRIPRSEMDWDNEAQAKAVGSGDLTLTDG